MNGFILLFVVVLNNWQVASIMLKQFKLCTEFEVVSHLVNYMNSSSIDLLLNPTLPVWIQCEFLLFVDTPPPPSQNSVRILEFNWMLQVKFIVNFLFRLIFFQPVCCCGGKYIFVYWLYLSYLVGFRRWYVYKATKSTFNFTLFDHFI